MSFKEKLRSYLSDRWDYEIQCDVFEGLNIDELTKIAKLYKIDPSLSRLEICNKLSKILEDKKREYKKTLEDSSCANTMDPITGTDVEDIDSRELITISQDGQMYCFEIEGIYKNVFLSNNFKNPYTNVPFNEQILKEIEDTYEKFKTMKGKKFDKDSYASDSSLTAVTGQLSNYLYYLSGMEKFIEASREKINEFLTNLELYDVSLIDFWGLQPTKLKVSEDTTLREYKINIVKKLIKWITENQYTNVREAWYYTFEDEQTELNKQLIGAFYNNSTLTDIQQILDRGANIELRDLNGRTLLHIAIEENADFEIFSYLIESGANTNAQDMLGNTPLMFAVESAAVDKVNLLLQYNVDVSISNNEEETALYLASKSKDTKEIIMTLLKNMSSISDINIKRIIRNVLENYDAEVLDMIIYLYPDFDVPINKQKDTPLIYAIKNLLEEDVINLLIKEGSSMKAFDKSKNTALLAALKVGTYPNVLKKIIELSDVNMEDTQGKTPSMIALADNNIEIVRLLVQKSSNINAADNVGNTALIYAVKNNVNLEIVKYLVENGADIKSANKYGETPINLRTSNEIKLYLDTKQ
jgi:ankyrin repeat protein